MMQFRSRVLAFGLVAIALLVSTASIAQRTQPSAAPASSGVPVLLLSDIHFDPFRDPAKVPQLASAPIEQWRAILDSPASADRAARLAALEKSCHTRGEDTDEVLFVASLKAIHAQARNLRFVTLAGDLMAHAFDCKFQALQPQASAADYSRFAAKTMDYVLHALRAALPGVPVYAALGNNDSGCGDYRLDPRSPFLADAARDFTADAAPSERAQALADFAALGNYSVQLPPPFRHLRILAIDNLFESSRYTGCAGKPDPAPAAEQLAWLRIQLASARAAGDKVWVVGHIPPGIDPYSTALHLRNVCDGQQPEMFLSSPALPDTLSGFGDVIALALFAHTHMDEMHLLSPASAAHGPVALKMTPSISPINGNLPAFTLARVDPATGTLIGYQVIASTDTSGTKWTEQYSFASTYGKPAFTAATAAGLIAGFHADPAASAPASQAYLHNYFVGNASLLLQLIWPQYTCALDNYTVETYRQCVCATSH